MPRVSAHRSDDLRGPTRRTRRPATSGSNDPTSCETPECGCHRGGHGPGRPTPGPTNPVRLSTTTGQPPRGSTRNGTGQHHGGHHPQHPPQVMEQPVKNAFSASRRPGATRVGQQRPSRRPRHEPPTVLRAQPFLRRPRSHPDRLNSITEQAAGREDPTQQRVQIVGQHREPNPHRLRMNSEPAQPTPHRRIGDAQPGSGPTEPVPGRSGDQREPDRPDRVPPSQQPERAQQHMGLPTTTTPRPARTLPPHPTPANPQHPQPGPPPRAQHPLTPRALQPAIEQGALDFRRVSSYDLHQSPRASGRALPITPARDRREGSCAPTKTRASPPSHR